MYPYDYLDQNDYLIHHGIKGQKWGVRRYQNPDGSLTKEGREHYGAMSERTADVASRAGRAAAISGGVTTGIAAYNVGAILAGASSVIIPVGPAIAFAATGAAYVSAKLANKYSNKKLERGKNLKQA